jgi:hypothetical protein
MSSTISIPPKITENDTFEQWLQKHNMIIDSQADFSNLIGQTSQYEGLTLDNYIKRELDKSESMAVALAIAFS